MNESVQDRVLETQILSQLSCILGDRFPITTAFPRREPLVTHSIVGRIQKRRWQPRLRPSRCLMTSAFGSETQTCSLRSKVFLRVRRQLGHTISGWAGACDHVPLV